METAKQLWAEANDWDKRYIKFMSQFEKNPDDPMNRAACKTICSISMLRASKLRARAAELIGK